MELKTGAQLAVMREAGRVVAKVLATVREHAGVGTSLLELDEIAASVIRKSGAEPSFLGYQPQFSGLYFPGVICASVNSAVLHGVPTRDRIVDGDLVSIDCGAIVDGWHGDAAVSFVVGRPQPGDLELIAATERALAAGLAAAVPGNRIGDISHAVETVARAAGYGILAHHGGHGIGRAMHEEPLVPNVGHPGQGQVLRAGLVLAIEPMLLKGGSDEYSVELDGWTVSSDDGSRAAHAEHTVAVTEDGPRVLTVL